MKALAFLVVLLAAFANGEILFTAKAQKSYIDLTCTPRYRNFVSILITKSAGDNGTYVASRSSYNVINNFTDSRVDYHFTNSLRLVWNNTYFNIDGTYTCIIYYLTQDNTPLWESEQTTIKLPYLDPIIATTPKHIQDGLTKSLVVECSSVNLGLHDMSLPAQIELFHIYNETEQRIASAATSPYNKLEATAENGWNIVSSNFAQYQILNLVVIRKLPTTRESGTYKCILSGANKGTIAQVVNTTQVTASVAKKQDIYDRVGEEDRQDYYVSACNFENGLCGFVLPVPSSDYGWKHVQSLQVEDIPDHTLGNNSGHYLRGVIPAGNALTSTTRSKEFPPMRRSFCVSFWYYVTGSAAQLSVYIRNNSTASPSNVFSSKVTGGWIYKAIPVEAMYGTFSVEIQFQNNNYYSYNGPASAIFDDFVVSDINCSGSQ